MTETFKDHFLGGRMTPFQGVWPDVDDSAYLFHGAQVIGKVTIAASASIWHNAVVRGDVNSIVIGERSNIQDGTVIHVATNIYKTIIGKDVLVAHMAMLHGCRLDDHSFVGIGCIVMDNTTIESDGMLAAGAMLTPGKTVKSGEMWAGRPAKFMRDLTDAEITKNRGMAEHYRLLAEQHKRDAEGSVGAAYPPEDKLL